MQYETWQDARATCVHVERSYVGGDGTRYQEHKISTPAQSHGWKFQRADYRTYSAGQSCGRNGCANS
jgi:hypothetical protein